MKVKIGKYPDTTLWGKVLSAFGIKLKRKCYVRIDEQDVWNADETLARVILPLLKELYKDKRGIPHIEDEDVPEELRVGERGSKDPNDQFDMSSLKWEYAYREMVYAFKYSIEGADYDESLEDCIASAKRAEKGHYLFGKYYTSLWT